MNISLTGLGNNAIGTKLAELLTPLERKVAIVAIAIFALAAVGFLFYRFYPYKKPQKEAEQKSLDASPKSQVCQLNAKDIIQAIEEKNDENLKKIVQEATPEQLREVLLQQEGKKGSNILAHAAHQNNLNAIDIICSAIDTQLLKKILLQKDQHEWTALHHLAIMNDNGKRYKELKKRADVDAKTASKFLCESPYMVRKYIRSNAGRFSTLSEKKPMHLYFRPTNLPESEEQRLPYQDLMQKHGHLFSRMPKYFKSIPQVRPELLQALWEDLPETVSRDEKRLQEIDRHLNALLTAGEEQGIALAPIKYNDKGEELPKEINVGIGGLARRDFKSNEIVSLYAGEFFTTKFPQAAGIKSDYRFKSKSGEVSDAMDVRSYGASFLHSAPNIRFEQISSALGFTFLGFKALEDIEKNQQLCESYGANYFKTRDILPLETRPAAREKMQKNPSTDPDAKVEQVCYLMIDASVR